MHLLRFASCIVSVAVVLFSIGGAAEWPKPHRKYPNRPKSDPYCKAGVVPFCPTGIKPNYMPTFNDNDTLYVYALKAPVWEFKFGSLLKKFHIMHDAIGFHHVRLGLNMTMEWYELFQAFNCTFPHEPAKNELLWCNQGATCIYPGIDEKHWRQNGTLVKVAEISGKIFNTFAKWTETDNNTYPFYETWTVKESTKEDAKTWFDPFDCASWVLRAFDVMHNAGAKFNKSIHLNYTKLVLYSEEPIYIGNDTSIFGDHGNLHLRRKLYSFYSQFQNYHSFAKILEHLVEFIFHFLFNDIFYLYYNSQYWELKLQEPFVGITYKEVPLPG